MDHCRVMAFNRCTAVVRHADSGWGGLCTRGDSGYMRTKFCREPNTALKSKVLVLKILCFRRKKKSFGSCLLQKDKVFRDTKDV